MNVTRFLSIASVVLVSACSAHYEKPQVNTSQNNVSEKVEIFKDIKYDLLSIIIPKACNADYIAYLMLKVSIDTNSIKVTNDVLNVFENSKKNIVYNCVFNNTQNT